MEAEGVSISSVSSFDVCGSCMTQSTNHKSRGKCNYSGMRKFGKIEFLKKEMAEFARFHKKFILKKSIIFVEFKKQNVEYAIKETKCCSVHINFPGSPLKLYIHHIYVVLGFFGSPSK